MIVAFWYKSVNYSHKKYEQQHDFEFKHNGNCTFFPSLLKPYSAGIRNSVILEKVEMNLDKAIPLGNPVEPEIHGNGATRREALHVLEAPWTYIN